MDARELRIASPLLGWTGARHNRVLASNKDADGVLGYASRRGTARAKCLVSLLISQLRRNPTSA